MIELSAVSVRLAFAGCYLLALLAVAPLVTRTPVRYRREAYLLTAVLVLSPTAIVLQHLGVGQVAVGAGVLDVVNLVQSVFASVVIYWAVLSVVDTPRETVAVTIGVAVTPTFAAALAPLSNDLTGILGMLFLLGTFLPFPVILYLFLGPIGQVAGEAPRRRYLMHWKARNVLLFTYAMLLGYILVSIAGLITDPIVDAFVLQYTVFFLYGGVATYLVYNYSRQDEQTVAESASTARGSATE